MPFCPKCGAEVGEAPFCPDCGAAQGPGARAAKRVADKEKALYDPRIGATMCCLGWFTLGLAWIGALIIWLTTEHDDPNKDVINTIKWMCIVGPIIIGIFIVMMLIALSIAGSF